MKCTGMRSFSLIAALACAGIAPCGTSSEDFYRENSAAMDHMMLAMNVPSSGDVDHDFVAMMTPHHQGAIEMAQLELRYGRNEQLRRLAQEIIVTQRDEITAMALAIGAGPTAPKETLK